MRTTPEELLPSQEIIGKGADSAKCYLRLVYSPNLTLDNFTSDQAKFAAARLIEIGIAYYSGIYKKKVQEKEHWLSGEYALAFINGVSPESIAEIDGRLPIAITNKIESLASQTKKIPDRIIPEYPNELLAIRPSYTYSPERGRFQHLIPKPEREVIEIVNRDALKEVETMQNPDVTIPSLKSLLPQQEGDYTKEEEVELVHWIHAAMLVNATKEGTIQTSQAFSKNEAEALIFLGRAAQELLIEKHRHIVKEVAKSFKGRGVEFDDLEAIGNIGLLKAIILWDESGLSMLHSYIRISVNGEIRNALRDNYRNVKIPHTIKNTLPKFWKIRSRFIDEFKRSPTTSELAIEMELDEDTVKKLQYASNSLIRPISLDAPVTQDDEGDARLLDWLKEPEYVTSDAHLLQWLRGDIEKDDSVDLRLLKKRAVSCLLKTTRLSPRELACICLRFGLPIPRERISYGPLSRTDVADELSTTYKSAFGLEKRALGKMHAIVEGHISNIDSKSYAQVLFELENLHLVQS